MAATAQGRRLTEAHRLAQARLGAITVRQMVAAWGLMTPDALDASTERWLRTVMPIITGQRARSARLAANYVATFKALEIGTAAVPVVLAETVPAQQLVTSLTVTGPTAVKTHMRIDPTTKRAMEIGQSMSARAAMRHVLGGGRDTITSTMENDSQALGWARATSGRPCAFCAMIASRGPVYKGSTVEFQPHDGCACTAEPVYRRDAAWPAGSERFRDLWAEASSADGDTTKNFRALVESA